MMAALVHELGYYKRFFRSVSMMDVSSEVH